MPLSFSLVTETLMSGEIDNKRQWQKDNRCQVILKAGLAFVISLSMADKSCVVVL